MSPANPDMKTYPPIEHHPSEPRHLQFAGTSQTVAMCMDEDVAKAIVETWNAMEREEKLQAGKERSHE